MAKRTERHERRVRETLKTPAARKPRERLALAANEVHAVSGKIKVGSADGAGRPAVRVQPTSVPTTYGGYTEPDSQGEIGTPGNLNVFGFLTGEDYNPDLDGYPMFPNFNKMRLGDAQVNACLLMEKLPIKGAKWTIEPGSQDNQDVAIAEFCQANLIDEGGIAKRNWQNVLDNAMLKFDFGCAGAEVIWGLQNDSATLNASRPSQLINLGRGCDLDYELADPTRMTTYAKINDIAPRLPRTFYRWVEDPKTNNLAFVQQFAPKNGQYGYYNIPVDRFIRHTRAMEGNNYYGRSVLRTAYPHWWWKQQLYRIDIVGHDRFHVGVPLAKLTKDYTANTAPLDKIQATLKGLRSHDRSYMVQPYGVEYDVFARDSSGASTNGIMLSVEHHNMMIARNILQSFAAQGEQRHGSLGAASVTVQVYYEALEGEAKELASDMQATIKKLCDLNFDMTNRPYPRAVANDMSGTDFSSLTTSLSSLAGQKLITPDDGLEEWLRDIAQAPEMPEELKGRDRSAVPNANDPNDPNNPNKKKKEDTTDPKKQDNEELAAAKFVEHGRAFSREPNDKERKILDLHGIPATLDKIRDNLIRSMADIRISQLKVIAARIAQKDGRDTRAFTDIRHANITIPQVDQLTKVIREAQKAAFDFGHSSVQTELKRSGKGTVALAGNPTSAANRQKVTSTLVSSARITAKRNSDAWLGRALDEGLRIRRSGISGPQLASRIVSALMDEAESGSKRDANSEVNEGFGLGRGNAAEEMGDELGETATYSAIMDTSTCDTCGELDGQEFRVGSDEYHANMPPNVGCDGKDQCRCVYIYEGV